MNESTQDSPPHRYRGRELLVLFLVVSGTSFAFGVGLPLQSTSARGIALAAFLAAAALCRPWAPGRRVALAAVTAVCGLVLAGLRPGIEGATVFVLTAVMALELASRARHRPSRRHVVGVTLFAALMVGAQGIDWLWTGMESLARGYSVLAGQLQEVKPRWGPSAAGVAPMILGLCLLAADLVGRGRVRPLRTALAVAGLLLIPLAVVAGGVEWIGLTYFANGEAFAPFAVQWLALPAVALLVWCGRPPSAATPRDATATRPRMAPAALAGALLVAVISIGASPAPPAPAEPSPRRIVFLDRMGTLADFSSPTWDRLGFGAGGIYGEVVRLLGNTGRTVEVHTGAVDSQLLDGAACLVVAAPVEPFAPQELRTIHDYVTSGGSLLVLADHTDLFGHAEHVNRLLEPYGVEVRFDTPMESTRAFIGNLEIRRTGVLPAWTNPIFTQILHGASLRTAAPATPLIVGRTMFGDFGNRRNGGSGAFLGNYRLAAAIEEVGDLVLAATASPGKGRVVVFGDTSSFQNVALPRATAFVLDVFRWLEGGRVGSRALPIIFLIAGVLALALLAIPRLADWAALAAPLVMALATLGLGAGYADGDNVRALASLAPRSSLLLHAGDLPLWDLDQFQDRSIQGLLTCAAREGLTPLVGNLERAESLDGCRIVVLPPMGRALDGGGLERLERFLADGGVVVAASGWEERRGIAEFLARQRLGIRRIPLGAAPVLPDAEARKHQGPRFAEAWPIDVSRRPDATVHFQVDGLPIAVSVPVGAGRLIVIGDSWFLTDEFLEGESKAVPANVGLLREMVFGDAPDAERRPR